jgi:uncharacterized protein (DUF1015 family)
MAEIIPFRGIYYNSGKVRGDEIVAPPYDLITPEMKEDLYTRSPYNAVHVDFGKELEGDGEKENKYSRSARFLEQWLKEGILIKSDEPAFYSYRMEYGRKSITGFFGLLRLSEFGKGIYPHEATHTKPKNDRFALMQATGANTSPIYSLFSNEGKDVSGVLDNVTLKDPYLQSTDYDGTVHSMWIVDGPEDVQRIKEGLSDASIFIADGHHRYETALDYQGAMRQGMQETGEDKPFDYVLMFFADIRDSGLTVLPTHRIVTVDVDTMLGNLQEYFDIYELSPDADIIDEINGKEHTFGLYAGGRKYSLKCVCEDLPKVDPALRKLDVVILHKMVFGRLLDVGNWAYEMDYKQTLSMVDNGEYDAAFFLNPTPVNDVERVALSGLRMPPKSTYFYPKVQTGFVMNDLKTF